MDHGNKRNGLLESRKASITASASQGLTANIRMETDERPSKRKRVCGDAARAITPTKNDDHHDGAFTLPPEVWAMAMNYLDYQSVLSFAATSKMLLHDAMPLVTAIHIDKSSQLNALASRFRDVQEVNIYSLLLPDADNDGDGEEDLTVDFGTRMRAMPFLCRFSKLKQVFFGGRLSSGEVIGFDRGHISRSLRKRVDTLVDSMSEAYQSRLLPGDLCLLGLRCLRTSHRSGTSKCLSCQRACNKWPLETVINFSNQGSSRDLGEPFVSNRSYSLDVCLTNEQINTIIETRSSGHILQSSEARFLALLGQGNCYRFCSGAKAPFYVVQFHEKQLRELKRFIESSKLFVSKLAREDVTRAIMRSFTANRQDQAPPSGQCYLADKSFVCMKEEIYLPIREEDFIAPLIRNNEIVPHIIDIMKSHCTIKDDCMELLSKIFSHENECQHHIQRAIDLEAVTLLNGFLEPTSEVAISIQEEAANLLGLIARNGNNATQVLIDKGTLPKLVRVAGECTTATEFLAKNALIALGRMANKSPTYRDAVLKAGAVESLLKQYKRWGYSETVSWMIIKLYEGGLPADSTMLGPILVPIYQLLLGDNDEAVLISACQGLYYLSVDSEERVQAMVGAGVYARLVELLHHSSRLVQSEVLNTISCLVRKENLSVEPLVSSNVLPVLMAFMSSTDDEDEQKDSCKIIFTIIEGLNEQTKTLVNHGCIRPLCASLSSNDVETIQYGLAGLAKVSATQF